MSLAVMSGYDPGRMRWKFLTSSGVQHATMPFRMGAAKHIGSSASPAEAETPDRDRGFKAALVHIFIPRGPNLSRASTGDRLPASFDV